MSWTGLQAASWGGIPFLVDSADGSWRRRIVRFAYPFRDGADSDDLGREPVNLNVSAMVMGAAYRSEFYALLKAFQEGGVRTLIHPVHGSIECRLNTLDDHESADMANYIALDLVFEEAGTDALAFSEAIDTSEQAANLATASADAADAALGDL